MFKYRLITTIITIPIIISILFLMSLIEFLFIMLILCMLSAWEWSRLAGIKILYYRILVTFLFGCTLLSMVYVSPSYQLSSFFWEMHFSLWGALLWWIIAFFLIFYYPRSAVLWNNSISLRILFGAITILPCFWGILFLRQHDYNNNYYIGSWWLLYIIVLVWGLDIGSYIFGKIFGCHKLAPKISPNKTWEGLIGGIFTTANIFWLFNKYIFFNVPCYVLIISSILAVLFAIIGDLTESMFKREVGIKDSGYIIPGHGGILDCLDSLTAAVPVFTCFILLIFHAI